MQLQLELVFFWFVVYSNVTLQLLAAFLYCLYQYELHVQTVVGALSLITSGKYDFTAANPF